MSNDSRVEAKSIISKVLKIEFVHRKSAPTDPRESIDGLVRVITQETARIVRSGSEMEQAKINESVLQCPNVQKQTESLKYDCAKLLTAYQLAKSEREQIRLIEHGQGFRRAVWRAISTASVTATIIIVWNLALQFEFSLPLIKVPGVTS